MKRNSLIGLTAVLALSITPLLHAQDEDAPKKDGPPPHPAPPVIAALDTNKDGTISSDEIANAPTSLKTLDKNNDGQLTKEELRPPKPGKGGAKGPKKDKPADD